MSKLDLNNVQLFFFFFTCHLLYLFVLLSGFDGRCGHNVDWVTVSFHGSCLHCLNGLYGFESPLLSYRDQKKKNTETYYGIAVISFGLITFYISQQHFLNSLRHPEVVSPPGTIHPHPVSAMNTHPASMKCHSRHVEQSMQARIH